MSAFKKDPVLEFLTATAKNYSAIQKLKLFGSRARGDHDERSDYDIAVYAENLSEAEQLRFCAIAEEQAPTLCKISLVFIHDIQDQKFLTRIEKEGVEI